MNTFFKIRYTSLLNCLVTQMSFISLSVEMVRYSANTPRLEYATGTGYTNQLYIPTYALKDFRNLGHIELAWAPYKEYERASDARKNMAILYESGLPCFQQSSFLNRLLYLKEML